LFAVFLAFITSQKHADSFASEKQLCNRVGLHHTRFEKVLWNNKMLCGKKFFKITTLPPNCESWTKKCKKVHAFWPLFSTPPACLIDFAPLAAGAKLA